jgi:hypothetical protein
MGTNTGTNAGTNTGLGTNTGTYTGLGTNTGTYTGLGTKTGTNTGMRTNTGTNTGMGTNTGTGTGTDKALPRVTTPTEPAKKIAKFFWQGVDLSKRPSLGPSKAPSNSWDPNSPAATYVPHTIDADRRGLKCAYCRKCRKDSHRLTGIPFLCPKFQDDWEKGRLEIPDEMRQRDLEKIHKFLHKIGLAPEANELEGI